MGEQKQNPGRPRKWASDAERMRAARAAQRAEREAASQRATKGSRAADGRGVGAPMPVVSPADAASQAPWPEVINEPVADHTDCEGIIAALRVELVDLEERYDDLVLSRWILAQKYERALGRMNLHDPAGIAWLVEQLAEWERDVEAKQTMRLQEPNRERVRRRYEEEFDRRLEHARRQSQQ